LSMARRPNERILLIEADLRRPTASTLLTSAPLLGISEWSAGKLALEDALYQVSGLPLWFLAAGQPMADLVELSTTYKIAFVVSQRPNHPIGGYSMRPPCCLWPTLPRSPVYVTVC